MSQIDRQKIMDRAVESIALVENPVYQEAVRALRDRYYSELIHAQPGTLTATAAHAKILALEEIQGQLNIFINDAKMQRQR